MDVSPVLRGVAKDLHIFWAQARQGLLSHHFSGYQGCRHADASTVPSVPPGSTGDGAARLMMKET
ncbi:hypothetical protein [Caenispirillum salinarum]|uniref:hypothetical protein n=1 Tax=Caenispirillum salinarum TaxID=859058 RepID=UPI00385149FD